MYLIGNLADFASRTAKIPPIILYGRLAQLVRASRLHRECRGFESLIAHHFCCAKMVNEAARLLFTRRQPLFTQNQRFSSHLHQFREALLVKSFHYAVASLHL